MYPLKKDPGKARKAFNAAVKKVNDPKELIEGLRRYLELDQRVANGYPQHPTTWLNGEGWRNEYPEPGANGRARPQQPRSPGATPGQFTQEDYANASFKR